MALVESSRLWTTGGAGDGASTYTRDNMAEMLRAQLLSDNTTQGVLNGLAVSGTASPLTLATGAACVYGFLHFCTTSGTMNTITTPAVNTTGLHVVLRADWTAQTVRVVAVRNTDGVGTTPSLTQTAGTTWEIRLATGTITTGGVIALTDARQFCSGPAKLTATRVPFAGTGGQLTDSADLTFADSTDQLAIGTTLKLTKAGSTQGQVQQVTASGASLLDLDAIVTDGASDATIRVHRSTSTSGSSKLSVFRGNGGGTSGVDLNGTAGTVTITPASATAPLILGANGQGQTVDGLAADEIDTLSFRRQGGSATDWSSNGTSNFTPTTMRAQAGVKRHAGGSASGSTTITFPVAFSQPPIILVSCSNDIVNVAATIVSASGATLAYSTVDATAQSNIDINWLALGPE